ncbi:aminomethyltransferase (plasmid) [Salipiger sp. CCB-MM3]|uniref:DUF1989 domain-containing protein n=1 Tax=Salipiger sp. CCB-MM3 TaxID=1792508 RepID=UPI00080AC1C7|nr:urea carboxylase-associated family protein [Salipiger sp. CCB-MM3]ANT63098.1 aminomethyltransferase [Salipiger sp. CCB-MM3]
MTVELQTGLQTIPAGHGVAVRLKPGETISIINTSGTQVVDTWAFAEGDIAHYMSMEHSRVENGRLCPQPGGSFFSNRRIEMLVMTEDTSSGVHDTIMAACDAERYKRLGCDASHRSCSQNLTEALERIGEVLSNIPQPLNLFMNIPITDDGQLIQGEPPSAPGDRVGLKALIPCIVAMSACPQDITPINGLKPTDAHFSIE